MKWRYYSLHNADVKAAEVILNNLAIGAFEHTLSRKLVARFLGAAGSVIAIALEGLDLHNLRDYSSATYNSGKRWYDAAGTRSQAIGDRSIDGLLSFLADYLTLSDYGVVVIEHSLARRSDASFRAEAFSDTPIHAYFFNNEIYSILSTGNTNSDFIEATIRDAWNHYFVGICANGITIPSDHELKDEFLNELVLKTQHIFVPAFDDEGFLVWTPRLSGIEGPAASPSSDRPCSSPGQE